VNVTKLSFLINWRSRSTTTNVIDDSDNILDIDTVLRYLAYQARIPPTDFVLYHADIYRILPDEQKGLYALCK